MSAQEIIKELTKLDRDQLVEIDLKLHELLEEKISTGGKSWGEALLEVAGTVEDLPRDYAESHDRYLHGLPRE
jgi:cephalosporin-C deacetylase-like acetyl esterase